MTHADDVARGDAVILPLVEKLDSICAVCRQSDCGHFDAHFGGIVPLGDDDQLHAGIDKA